MNHDSGYVKIKVHDIIDRKHILHELITWGLWLKVRLPGRRRRGWSERMLSMGKKKLDWFYLMSSLIPIKVAMRCLRPAPFKLKTPPIACWTKWTSNQQVLRGMEPSMNRLQKKFLLDLGLSGFLFIVGVSSHNKKKTYPPKSSLFTWGWISLWCLRWPRCPPSCLSTSQPLGRRLTWQNKPRTWLSYICGKMMLISKYFYRYV